MPLCTDSFISTILVEETAAEGFRYPGVVPSQSNTLIKFPELELIPELSPEERVEFKFSFWEEDPKIWTWRTACASSVKKRKEN